MHATRPAHVILLDLISLKTFAEQYKYTLPHFPPPSLLLRKTILTILF
jgi:hypothetical protein